MVVYGRWKVVVATLSNKCSHVGPIFCGAPALDEIPTSRGSDQVEHLGGHGCVLAQGTRPRKGSDCATPWLVSNYKNRVISCLLPSGGTNSPDT